MASTADSHVCQLISYMESVEVAAESGAADDLLLKKCLEECTGYEEALCLSREASRLLETIFGTSSQLAFELLKRIWRLKRKKILDLVCNRCGSHVLETLLYTIVPLLKPDSSQSAECTGLLTEWAAMFREEWAVVSGDLFGSHVIRCLGRVLSGLDNSGRNSEAKQQRSVLEKFQNSITQTTEMNSNFRNLATLALDWKLMSDYMHMESVALLMQEFVELTAKNKAPFISSFLESCFQNATTEMIEQMWCDKQASRIWEKILMHCSEDEAERIYQIFLQGKLAELATDRNGNFPLQTLVKAARSEEMLTDILDELEDCFGSCLERKHIGVLISLVSGAINVPEKSEDVLKVFMKGFGCYKPKSRRKWLIPCCLKTSTFESLGVSEELLCLKFETANISLQGSLLAQKMLDLCPNERVLKSFTEIEPSTLRGLACSVTGSHVVDRFYSNSSLGQQHKELLFHSHFEGHWEELACDKYGSRVLDTAWKNVAMKAKCTMAAELSNNARTLTDSKFGRIVYRKYGLELFKKSVKEWRNMIASSERKRKMLEDLIK